MDVVLQLRKMSGRGVRVVRWEKVEGEEDQVQLIAEDINSPADDGITRNENKGEFGLDDDGSSNSQQEREERNQDTKTRTPLFVYVITFFSIIGGFLFGYDTGVIAGALLELDKDFHLDATKKELVVSVTVAAAALGAIVGGPLNEKLGRKRTIMVASVVFTVGAVVMAVAPLASWGWTVVLAGRFIVGIGIGQFLWGHDAYMRHWLTKG